MIDYKIIKKDSLLSLLYDICYNYFKIGEIYMEENNVVATNPPTAEIPKKKGKR